MTSTRLVNLTRLGLTGLMLLAVGCAQEVGDIDRTQPNRIVKSALEGEWYFQRTVVDVNATAIQSFVGLEGQTERIVWEWEEDYLVGYRSHEDVFGIDTSAGQEWTRGRPVVGFPANHFDVQRQYNSSTGEQSNVIVENSSDRPWYEREHARVDWTRNHIENGVNDSFAWIEHRGQTQIILTPQDEGDEPTWFIEYDETGQANYIDVLNTYVIYPDYVECALQFGIPLWGSSCGPETIVVRTSLMRIDTPSEEVHAVREYSDLELNDFGIFPTQRPVWDERYGVRDSTRVQVANIMRIWEDAVNDDGSTIPYADRTPRPVVYYLSDNFPEPLIDDMFAIGQDYDNALRRIVATHWGVEVPNDPREIGTEVSYDDVPRMFYVCENPGSATEGHPISQEGYQNGYCEREGETKNLGDIRYSMFNWVDRLQMDGPLGYGPSSVDTTTGEILSARANMYGEGVNTYVQYALDLAKLISGDYDEVTYGDGEQIREYFDQIRDDANGDVYYGRLERSRDYAADLEIAIQERLETPRVRELLSRSPDSFRLRHDAEAHPLERYRGTELERMAIFPEMQARLSNGLIEPDRNSGAFPDLDNEWVDRLSIASIGDPARLMASENARLNSMFMRGPDQDCVLTQEIADPSLIGLATQLAEEREQLRAEGMSSQEIDDIQWEFIRAQLMRYVMAHEVGHNFGLFHNFEGSFDALNFPYEYWELRQQTFDTCDSDAVTFANNGFFTGNVAPRRCTDNEGNQILDNGETVEFSDDDRDGEPDDPRWETEEEYQQRSAELHQELMLNNIHGRQFSSVMDYTNRYFNNVPGLGRYDYAALAYAYGELVEVFDSEPMMLRVEVAFDEENDVEGTAIRQSQFPIRTFDDVDEYVYVRRGVDPEADSPNYTREERDRGQEHSHEWYHYSVLPMMFGGDIDAMYDRSLVPLAEQDSYVRVPYRFCSDFYRGSSIECNVFDQGADYLEIFQDAQNSFDGYYYLSFFRRERPGFGLWLYPVLSRLVSRTMAPMTRLYQHWLIRAAGRGVEWYTSEYGGDAATVAAFAGADFLRQVITRPSIGTYYYDEDDGMFLNLDDEQDYRPRPSFELEENIDPDSDYFNVGADIGRYGFERYRRSDDVNEELLHFGIFQPEVLSWFWAKWAAMMAMVNSSVEIVGSDTSSDSQAFSIPYYLVFDDDMTRFFGALPREDMEIIGSCAMVNGRGKVEEVIQRNLVNTDPSDCDDAMVLNPYAGAYGNGDFNMRLLSLLYAAAYFQTNYEMTWFDRSNVYIVGRGHTPTPADDWVIERFVEDNGLQYIAAFPEELLPPTDDEGNVLDVDPDTGEPVDLAEIEDELLTWPGVQMIRRANHWQQLRDAEEEENGLTEDYYRYNGELGSLVEMIRLQSQANELFEGYNVFLPFTL